MRRFVIFATLFIAPLAIAMLFLEVLVHYIPNSYSYKYNYVKEKGKEIEAIAIGHSQLYDDFKPESFKIKAFNLSNSNQTYKDTYYIIKNLLVYMPNLKLVIIPLGYLDAVEKETDDFTNRTVFYHEYMNIDYDGRLPIAYKMECLNPKRAANKVFRYFIKHDDIIGCDSLGRRSTHNLANRTFELGFEKRIKECTRRSKTNLIINNEQYLKNICDLLSKHNIKLVMVSPPYYWKSSEVVNENQKEYVRKYAYQITSLYNYQYLNLEDGSGYEYDDFFDETHLTEIGAEKFTQQLNQMIKI